MATYDETTARIRMVILTKPGMPNYEWHSYDKYTKSRVSDEAIIAGMLRRFVDKPYARDVQIIQFYDNQTNVLLKEFEP